MKKQLIRYLVLLALCLHLPVLARESTVSTESVPLTETAQPAEPNLAEPEETPPAQTDPVTAEKPIFPDGRLLRIGIMVAALSAVTVGILSLLKKKGVL